MPKTAPKSCIPERTDREASVISRPMVRSTILRVMDALEVLGRVSRYILTSHPNSTGNPIFLVNQEDRVISKLGINLILVK